ncbi:MAG: DUF2271 domain-containing protein [Oscillospiraceae bacterium]|nr:DUF2271 domain-containing protein [Oscillospiraceae bacterium]
MKKRTKIILLCIAAFIVGFVCFAYVMVMNPFNIGIYPLMPALNNENTGKRLEISFIYTKQRLIASSQYAFWIEDMDGNYIDTIFVTQWTATGGYSYRPHSIPLWVSAAQPSGKSDAQIDAISGATPRNGVYVVSWDFTDSKGNPVTQTQFRYFIEGTMNNEDDVLYTGTFTTEDGAWSRTPIPSYTIQDSGYKGMLSNVIIAFYEE